MVVAGSGDTHRARLSSRATLCCDTLLLSVMATVLLLLRRVFGRLYSDDERVIAQAAEVAAVYVLYQV